MGRVRAIFDGLRSMTASREPFTVETASSAGNIAVVPLAAGVPATGATWNDHGTATSPTAPSDDALMAMARTGNRQAFDDLIRRYQARAVGIALRHTGDTGIAREVAQEAFVDLFRALPTYQPRGKFSAFLFRLLINRCRMEFRRRRRESSDREGGTAREQRDDTTSLDLVLAREQERRLRLEVQKLAKPLRDVLALWGDGLRDREIAEILGTPLGTVRRRRFDALERLRARLEGE
jgi:RNA polymerase sigma-70 factor, ECF subfamily